MTEEQIPESRTYRHTKCGNEIVVGDDAFGVVSNPMSSMERTQCSACEAMFPIAEFEWVDTGETIQAYYDRHSQDATDLQRFLCSKKMLVGLSLLGGIVTAGAFYLLVADDDLFTRLIVVAGGLMIGALIGSAIFLNVLANPITRKVCGVSDTRLLK